EAIEEVYRRVDRQRERYSDGDDGRELQPFSREPEQRTGREDREKRRQNARDAGQNRAQCDAQKNEDDEHVTDEPDVQLPNERGGVPRGDRGQTGYGNFIVLELMTDRLQRLIDLLHDRKNFTRVHVR